MIQIRRIEHNHYHSVFYFQHSSPNCYSHGPVDTGRKLNVNKTFGRRPGRLLNVLFTFNLRLVSTGEEHSILKLSHFLSEVQTFNRSVSV